MRQAKTEVVAIDTGNYDIKTVTARGNREYIRHALAPLSNAQWARATAQGTPPDGFYLVNGEAYALGDPALRLKVAPRKNGAQRYEASYVGVIVAVACYRMAQGDNIQVLLSYPPVDYAYRHDLMKAVTGAWTVYGEAGTKRMNIEAVGAFDEPMGGMARFGLTEDGRIDGRTKILTQTTLMIDAGGYTIDVLPVDAGMLPDYTASGSTRIGTLELMRGFEQGIRTRYRDKFKQVGDIMPNRIEGALLSGKFMFGSKALDVADEAQDAIVGIVNEVASIVDSAGGIINYDRFILTGGGSAILYPFLKTLYSDIEVKLAVSERDVLRFANADGYIRLYRLLANEGAL